MLNFPKLTTIIAVVMMSITANSQISINSDGSSPDGSAMLDIKSTEKGMLPPRMTEAQRDNINGPATGLMIYNTTNNSLDFFNGIKWISVSEDGVTAQNLPPEASNVSLSGMMGVGGTLTGSYTYSDYETDAEGTSTFQWYRAEDLSGTNQVAISGGTALSYQLVTADAGKFISFEVIPVAQAGTTTGTSAISSYQGPILDVGDFYGGGVIFYFFQPGDPGYLAGETHGLICSIFETEGLAFSNGENIITGATETAVGYGQANTTAIISSQGPGSYAATFCDGFEYLTYSDWYLPTTGELDLIYQSKTVINTTSIANGGDPIVDDDTGWYLSSTEYNISDAWYQMFINGWQGTGSKISTYRKIRPVRTF